MALPKEPRQKMINLMYLVLTALLALNVSAEILNAFKTVESSLASTNITINASTDTYMKSFQDLKSDPSKRAKAEQWEPAAVRARSLTKNMFDFIENLKKDIYKEAGLDPAKNGDSTFKEDNQDIATRMLADGPRGKELYDKLTQYKKDMAAISPELSKDVDKYMEQINMQIPKTKSHGSNITWQGAYFRMVPTVAAITMLTKFQNDVKTSENRTVARFHAMVGEVKIRFDQFAAMKSQNTNYLMPGQELQIQAGLGSFSKQNPPSITIGGKPVPVDPETGLAQWKTAVTSIGQGSIPIHYEWKDLEGNLKTYDDKITYEVGQSSAAISLPEMNVLYIGYPNKVHIAGGGVGAEKIGIRVSGGGASVTGANGDYTVNVNSQTDECIITAVNNQDGKSLGALTFRVRQLPEPAASVGNQKSGAYVNAAAIANQPGVAAAIENFPIKLGYQVTRFEIVTNDPETGDLIREKCQGNQFTGRARQIMKQLKSGDIITIEDIQCTGPGGNRKLASLLYNIN